MTPTEKYPPSFMQEWMLRQQLSHGNLPVWNRPTPLEIIGKLDEDALNKALMLIQRRHLPLHSKFDAQEKMWQTATDMPKPLDQSCIDLSAVPNQKQAILEHIEKLNATVFDLINDFPFRAQLLKLSSTNHLLNLSFHHISIDGGAVPILIEQISSLYEKIITKQDIDPSVPAYPFDQFSTTEKNNYPQKQEKFLNYHRDYFSPNRTPLILPGYKSSGSVHFEQGYLERKLDQEKSKILREFSTSQNSTLFICLYTIFNVLIFLTTARTEILLGAFFSDRRQAGLKETLGLLFNIIPIQLSLDPTMTFRRLLTAARQRCLKAFSMADYPYIKFLEHANAPQSPELLPVIFQFRNFPKAKPTSALNIREYPYRHLYGNFDITFEAEPVDGEMHIKLYYRADRYSENTMSGLLNDYCRLISQLLENPESPLSRFAEG